MSGLENGLKVTVLTQSAINFFSSDTLKVTGSTISTPKSYDEHSRQVKYGSPPPPPIRRGHNTRTTPHFSRSTLVILSPTTECRF